MIDQLIDLWIRGWRSAFEILLLSVAIYYGYLYFRGTRGAKVLTGSGDRFFDAYAYFDAAQFGCDRLDCSKFFSFPRSRAGSDFSAGTAAGAGRARRTSDFLTNERKT